MAVATKATAQALKSKTYAPDSSVGQRILRAHEIKTQIDKLTAEYEAEKSALLSHAVKNNLSSLACGAVTFVRKSVSHWSYSTAIRNAEALLKIKKQKEQETGIAVNNPTDSLAISVSAKALVVEINALKGL